MFNDKQEKLFNKGYGAYRNIIKLVMDHADLLGQDKDESAPAIVMLADMEIQKMLLDISSCEKETPTEEEQQFIKSMIESSDALKGIVPGYGRFYRNMSPENYLAIKEKMDELSHDVPLALGLAVNLQKLGVDCVSEVIDDYRTIFDAFSAVSEYKEEEQGEKISNWLDRFILYSHEHGVNYKAAECEDGEEVEVKDNSASEEEQSGDVQTSHGTSAELNVIPRMNMDDDELTEYEKDLLKNWVGTLKDVHEICNAFLHRYVAGGSTSIHPKTHIVILGTESRGRVLSVKAMAKVLKDHKLTCNENVSIVDFSNYPLGTDPVIFLSDLYRGLYLPSEIIVFDNLELADNKQIEALHQLMSTGIYHLDQRYLEKGGALFPATGILSTETISEIHANDKIFVLVSSESQTRVVDILGEKITSQISDIVQLDSLGEPEIERLVDFLCTKMIADCRRELHLRVKVDELFKSKLSSVYDVRHGAKGIEKYLRLEVYNPLIDLCLAGRFVEDQKVFITYDNDEFWAEDEEHYGVALTEYTRSYNQLELDKVKKELSEVIGLEKVKDYVYSLENNIKIQRLRKRRGLKSSNVSMHMIFAGNPGTGKTTIARIVARYLKSIGVLSSGQLREVTRADLVGQYVGHTAPKTSDVIKSAVGGVLFIDEAYSLCRDRNDVYGKEAVDALVKGMEDNRDDLVVILAGYSKEMEEFMKANPGLKSRFPNVIHFEDYSTEEMWKIAEAIAKGKGYRIADTCYSAMCDEFDRHQIKGKNEEGNGRLVRNMVEGAILRQSQRISKDTSQDLELLITSDFGFVEKKPFDLESRLSEMVGLERVKNFVRTQYKLQQANIIRKKMGMSVDTSQSLNMIFAGNPGTGKTTMARLVADMFHELGILKSGQLVETDKGGLIAQYVGQTAQKTEEVFKSALGGVLFIDEAYAITNDNSSFGQECIDTLVKLIEDYRGELLVILAGYSKEMKNFMKSNSGLESRFPLFIEFPDYSAAELSEIGLKMIKSKGFELSDEGEQAFIEEIEEESRIASENSGNGRLVRNIVEEIIRKQSIRIVDENASGAEINTIIARDVHDVEKHQKFDIEEELKKIIGLDTVKEFVRDQYKMCLAKDKMRKANVKLDTSQSLNMVFTGNPGTGKTTIARVISRMFKEMGILKKGQIIETDKGGLIAQYVGQTAQKTSEVFKSALGGVLFIDEAYGITNDGSEFGQECIDTLVKLIEDHKGEIIVILAGYTKEMNEFMKANSGLESRFPLTMEFPDYTAEELVEIGKLQITGKGYVLSEEAENIFKDEVKTLKRHSGINSGNGRMVRNYVEEIIRRHATRIAIEDVDSSEINCILPEDVKKNEERGANFDLEAALSSTIGLESVKNYIRGLNARLKVQEERRKAGLSVNEDQTLHMIFAGNPGTGKTTMARIVANILYEMGAISSNKLVETDRADLVAGYVGQTAIKTRQVIERALNGVLFIDEAYSLAQGGDNDFGKEAIDTLVKMMDDNRDRLVVILAGYTNDMRYFLDMNPGLKSRFANIIEFSDYTTDELVKIAEKFYSEQGYNLTDDALAELRKLFDVAKQDKTFGNGRFVRNVFEKTLNSQAIRISKDEIYDTKELTYITGEDVKMIVPELKGLSGAKAYWGFK